MGRNGQMITLSIGDTSTYREGVSPLLKREGELVLAIIKRGRNPDGMYSSVQYSSMIKNLVFEVQKC
jgi:hypothetical protein